MKTHKQRIFWLGMHKVLKPTELRQLRALGYEVFNPAYLSEIYDQSADLTVDFDQPTTLPLDIFKTLLSYNFFYTSISPLIADILNEYFDAVIVTINGDWFKSIVEVYKGTIIYRIYGQPYTLSDQLIANGSRTLILERNNIFVIPFAAESIEGEHQWFLNLCTKAVPYQIPDDSFDYTGTWGSDGLRPEIAVSIPNIDNPYYNQIYHKFRAFPQSYFRILGPQRTLPADPRILGSMRRDRFLKMLSKSAGYFYPYQDNVCYLPPIEAMQIGNPVIYLPGSLLARFGEPDSPGLAAESDEAVSKLEKLIGKDTVFAAEVVAAQEPIRQRYDRGLVAPQFEKVILQILGSPDRTTKGVTRPPVISSVTTNNDMPAIGILLHIDGLFSYVDGKPSAFEGIPRVVDVLVDSIVSSTEIRVVVTCNPQSEAVVSDFFRTHIDSGRLSVYVLKFRSDASDHLRNLARLEYVAYLNSKEANIQSVLIPHYYLFPEALLIDRPITLYLPDYFPHLLPDAIFDVSAEKDLANKEIGVSLAQKSLRILTNSAFTKSYLSAAGFVEAEYLEKVVVAPLPLLGGKRTTLLNRWAAHDMRKKIGKRRFLFYPTANRPNKNLVFLLRLLAHLRLTYDDLCLVLTCNLHDVKAVHEAANNYQLHNHLILMPGASDSKMRWLYENTAALCLTSVAEGNFPPQMLEALAYSAPIVSTRLPTITETVEVNGELLLCEPLNLIEFADGVEFVLENREIVLKRQNTFLLRLSAWNEAGVFRARLPDAFPNLRLNLLTTSA